MSKKYAFVTGAAGFIGSRLTEALISRGRFVIAVDSFLDELYPASTKQLRWNKLKSLKSDRLELLEFDLRSGDFEQFRHFEIDAIFNQAALPGLINNPSIYRLYYECNISGLNRLLEFAQEIRVRKFIQASTSSVYGKSATGDENSELKPISPYGVSKLAAEKLLFAYHDSFQLPITILRYFSVYGPGQRPDMAYAKLIKAAITGGEFKLFGDGLQKRSNTFIDDIVNATMIAEEVDADGEIFNVCGDETVSLLQAINEIESELGISIKLVKTDARIGDQKETSGINSKIKSRFNWTAQTDFRTGIRKQIQYAKQLSSPL